MDYVISKKESNAILDICRTYYIDDEKQPLELAYSQTRIFSLITNKDIQRGQIETNTQYGKSLTIALGALWIAKFQGEDVAIIAPTDQQASIIMNYVIDHIGDNEAFQEGLIDNLTILDRLKVKKSRDEIRWLEGGRVKCYTVSAISSAGVKGKKVMGLHASVIIVDEACLIPNDHFSKIFRMLAGKVGKSRLIKIGNPFHMYDEDSKREHHFYKSHKDERYALIWIDYKTAIEESRLTSEYVEEARETMSANDFRVLFEVLFPIQENFNAFFSATETKSIKTMSLEDILAFPCMRFAGADISGQGDDDTILTRLHTDGNKYVVRKQTQITGDDLTEKSEKIHAEIQTGKETVTAIGIDSVGVGLGVADILKNREDRLYYVQYYIANAMAEDPKKSSADKEREKVMKVTFYNKKTELIYFLKQLIREERLFVEEGVDFGQLFHEMLLLTERTVANKRKKIDDPDDSPDNLDSLLASIFASQFYHIIT